MHLPPADPRSSWVARIALLAAILGSALTFVGVGLFDPFGARQEQADAVSRDTVAVVLCALVDTQEERARTLADAPGGLQEDARRARLSAAALRQLSEDLLQRSCGPPGRTATIPEEAP